MNYICSFRLLWCKKYSKKCAKCLYCSNSFLPLHSRKEPIEPGDVAQSVEQRTENPCVGGSIPSITTECKANRLIILKLSSGFLFGLHSGLQFLQNLKFSTPKYSVSLDLNNVQGCQNRQLEPQLQSPFSGKFFPPTLSFLISIKKFYFFSLCCEIKQNTPKQRLDAFNTS